MSNQKYSVWDSYSDMALSLSPSIGNAEVCRRAGCKSLISASSWNQGYRCCDVCMNSMTDKAQNEQGEQTALNNELTGNSAAIIATDLSGAEGEAAFKRALMDAERNALLNDIPKNWKV
jgi:hypothetical protein